jgi:UDP-glucuronate decarboxylase
MKIDDRRVVPNFLNAALDEKTIEIHNNGAQTRTFAYASDAVNGFFHVLLSGRPGEAYNIGSDDDEISMLELAKRVEKAHGKPLSIALAPYPEGYPIGDPSRRKPDLTKARNEFGYRAKVSLHDGLTRTLRWFELLRARA